MGISFHLGELRSQLARPFDCLAPRAADVTSQYNNVDSQPVGNLIRVTELEMEIGRNKNPHFSSFASPKCASHSVTR